MKLCSILSSRDINFYSAREILNILNKKGRQINEHFGMLLGSVQDSRVSL